MMNANMDMKTNMQINKDMNFIPQGWECPKCGAIMAPWQNCCVNCIKNKQPYASSYSGTITTYCNPNTTQCINMNDTYMTAKFNNYKTAPISGIDADLNNKNSIKNALNANLRKN